MNQLLKTAKSLGNIVNLTGLFLSNTFVLTAGAFNYRGALYNWIHHMEQQKLRNYLVLCFDAKIYEVFMWIVSMIELIKFTLLPNALDATGCWSSAWRIDSKWFELYCK